MMKPECEYYTGSVIDVYSGYSSDSSISSNAASGGIVTGLLVYMLEKKIIDGALVYRLGYGKEKPEVQSFIARSKEELQSAQGSIYIAFPALGKNAQNMIREFSGKLAVVGLPCSIRIMRNLAEKDPALKEKIFLYIGLFCGHTSKPELLDHVLRKKNLSWNEISSFRFRKGLWRGNAEACCTDGRILIWKTAFYNLYQNCFVLAHTPCLSCFDHYAEQADFICGDIWQMKHRNDSVKHSIFAVRTEKAAKITEQAIDDGVFVCEKKNISDLFGANSRSAVFHKAIRARAIAGRLFGIKIQVPEEAAPARWNEIAAAVIVMGLYRLSVSKYCNIIFKMPRFILKFMLYGMKLLTSF